MRLVELIFFSIFIMISWVLIKSKTDFNPEEKDKKYIILPRSIAKYFVNQKSSYVKYVKVKDRQKLSIPCFIGYLACIITVLTAIVMYFLPLYPCSPIKLPLSRRRTITISSYNAKIPYIMSLLIFFTQIDIVFVKLAVQIFKVESQEAKLWMKILIVVMCILFTAFILYLVYAIF